MSQNSFWEIFHFSKLIKAVNTIQIEQSGMHCYLFISVIISHFLSIQIHKVASNDHQTEKKTSQRSTHFKILKSMVWYFASKITLQSTKLPYYNNRMTFCFRMHSFQEQCLELDMSCFTCVYQKFLTWVLSCSDILLD